MTEELPPTALDEVADDFSDVLDRGVYQYGADLRETYDAESSVWYEFTLNNREYDVLFKSGTSAYSSWIFDAYLYPADADIEQDVGIRHTDYIAHENMKSSSLHDEDVQDDVAHAMATVIGKFVRVLLDGRNYSGYGRNPHKEAPQATD